MELNELKKLIAKYQSGTATEQDIAFLESWYTQHPIMKPFAMRDDDRTADVNAAWLEIEKQTNNDPRPQQSLWPRIAAAASIVLALSIGGYFILHRSQPVQQIVQMHDVAPGGNKAILTLANGKKIILTDVKNGQLANQNNIAINKTTDGQIAYSGKVGQTDVIEYNTMTTPRGGQYTVVLADGTKVILNAASSLKYPAAFNGNDRRVELSGEAYFEVAHNKAKPFKVISNGQTVEVLGTHFDVNAYGDESVTRTTLLQGSVKVTNAQAAQIISPGQQAVLKAGLLTVVKADTENVIAWVNGDFDFKDEKIENVMRKLSRWYDIDVTYNTNITKDGFNGQISKFKNISQVLDLLQQTKGVHFKIDGRRVMVMK